MAKQFKLLRIPSFQCCRSSDISVVPTDPPPPLSPSSKPHHSSLRHHVSSAFRTATCGCRSSSTNSDDDHQITKTSPTLPRHVPPTPFTEPYDDVSALPKQQRRKKKKSKSTTALTRLRISTSSAESGLFSSESFDEIDELEETETLISSSKTISTTDDDDDSSSEFNPQLETIREKPYKNGINLKKKKKKEKRRRSSNRRQRQRIVKASPSPESESPARLSVFQRLIPCTVDGKIKESFAVVKKSEDPFEDFKRSMMEMIMEKEMFDEKDLEQLLHCLLSLNDREHHAIIVEAFSEIWQSLFCNRSTSRPSF